MALAGPPAEQTFGQSPKVSYSRKKKRDKHRYEQSRVCDAALVDLLLQKPHYNPFLLLSSGPITTYHPPPHRRPLLLPDFSSSFHVMAALYNAVRLSPLARKSPAPAVPPPAQREPRVSSFTGSWTGSWTGSPGRKTCVRPARARALAESAAALE